jgi:gliding motility-associated-like protein
MKKIIATISILLITTNAIAQKENANWYFGERAVLDFNKEPPVPRTDGQLVSQEGCASISDKNGNLQFYTNGQTIWNKDHGIMQNGSDLAGHTSSTQSALIIPKPGNSKIYYVFTVDKPNYYLTEGSPIKGVNYSIVDMSMNAGKGEVLIDSKNTSLITYDPSSSIEKEYKSTEKITAVLNGSETGYWVVTQLTNKFYAFIVDESGVNNNPVISETSQKIDIIINDSKINKTAIGSMKISPDGSKIAIAHSSTSSGGPRSGTRKNGKVYLYDFDDVSGKVSGGKSLLSNEYPYGVEFSRNSEKLYVTSSIYDNSDKFVESKLYQYEVNGASTKKTINSSINFAGALQLALNDKIYRAGYPARGGNSENISVINKPNQSGGSSDYVHNKVYLNKKNTFMGLPPSIRYIIREEFEFEYTCLGDSTHFFTTSNDPYDTIKWSFGDGNYSNKDEPDHIYSSPGTYEVTMTYILNGVVLEPITDNVTITPGPSVLVSEYELVQCDTQDNDPTDGLSTFNLSMADEFVHFENMENVEIHYYNSIIDAENDSENSSSLEASYNNIVANELIHAKIIDKETKCYSISKVRLIATEPLNLNMPDYYVCDIGSNTGEFNLYDKKQEIITALNLPINTVITFHINKLNASLSQNPLQDTYISEPKTIYIRGEVDNACLGTGKLDLKIYFFPTIIEEESYVICWNQFPKTLNTEIPLSQTNNYSYLWNTGEVSSEISIDSGGEYSVIITDKLNLCSKTKTVNIIEITKLEINDVVVTDGSSGNNVNIRMSDLNKEYLYALDNENTFQNSSIFNHILPGLHTVYVTNKYGCEVISKELYILGFPKFFTPNYDGVNEFWQIKGLNDRYYKASSIQIYNRFGKIVAIIDPQSRGWDGYYNETQLPASDYWFTVQLTDPLGDIELKKGHFSLIRRY